MITEDQILQAVVDVRDPLGDYGLVEHSLIHDIVVNGSDVKLKIKSIIYSHPEMDAVKEELQKKIASLDGVDNVKIEIVEEVPVDNKLKDIGRSKIKNVIAVASGKGGVGKTTVAVSLAVLLAKMGAKVGLMDADVYGPNVPIMMGVNQLPHQSSQEGIEPAEAYGVKMISIGFMVKPGQPIVWRGPMLHSAIQQFITDVSWGELDYLVVDLPPGTGDVQLSLAQTLSITGGVIVTLPQQVSLEDALRGLEMFRQMEIPILGVVENMSYLTLPNGDTMDVFGTGGGERMAKAANVSFLGAVPMDPGVRQGGDSGKPLVIEQPESVVTKELEDIAIKIALKTGLKALDNQKETLSINIS